MSERSLVKRRVTRAEASKQARERILDATLAIIGSDGLAAATTKRIAKEAGVSEGSLYNYFKDKPDLLVCLVLDRLPGIKAAFQPLFSAAPLAARLEAMLVQMIAFYSDAQPISAGIAADPKLVARCRAHFDADSTGPRRAHEKLSEALAAELREGRLAPGTDPDVLAALLIGAATEYASLSRLTGHAPANLPPDAYAQRVMATLAPILKN